MRAKAPETLASASRRLRDAADAADTGPWTYDGQTVWNSWPDTAVATTGLHENGTLIALMGPGVAFAVADVLDSAASDWRFQVENSPHSNEVAERAADANIRKAIKLARAVLDGASS